MSAGVDPQDCCPRCGTPYLGLLKPGDPPGSRHCDVCGITAAQALEMLEQEKAAHRKGEDELALQLVAGEEKPRSRRGSPRPVAPGSGLHQPAPWMRWRSGRRRKGLDAAKAFAVRVGSVLALLIAGILAYQIGWPYVKEKFRLALNTPAPKAAPAQGESAAASASPSQKNEPRPRSYYSQKPRTTQRSSAAPAAAVTPAPAKNSLAGTAAGPAPGKTPAETHEKVPDAPQPEPSAKPAVGRAPNLSDGQDDRPTVAPAKTTDNVVDDEDLEAKKVARPPQSPATVGEKAAAKKDETADAAAVLGLRKKEPDTTDPSKAPAPAVVSDGDPAIVPFDAQKMDSGHDKSFSLVLANALPGWHSKDVNEKNSSVGITHRGRDGVLAINPINEILPAKLIASVDIPPKSKAKLLFEVSSKDGSHEWLLSVRIANAPILQKVPIRTQDPVVWQPVPLDLSMCAGKRVEIVIEIAMNLKPNPKTPQKTYTEQVAYLRNMHLDWPGKPQTPQKQAEEPKAQQ